MTRLIFAKHRTGRIVSVDEVPRGLSCECVCIDCGSDLIARQGDIRDHSFAHTSGHEHDWVWETHLHAYAKQVIIDAGGLVVPLQTAVSSHLGLTPGGERTRLQAGAVPVRAEVSRGAVRPDLLLQLPDRKVEVALEVRVTHRCGREKLAEYKRQRLAVLEIDLSRFPSEKFDRSRVADEVLNGVHKKAWLWPLPPPAPVRPLPPPNELDEIERPLEGPAPPAAARGPEPPLPPPISLLFPVRAWNSEITVTVRPAGEGVQVIVHDMPMGLGATPAQNAAPRIAQLVAETIASFSADAQEQRAGYWFVSAWDATKVAEALKEARDRYVGSQAQAAFEQSGRIAADACSFDEPYSRLSSKPSPPEPDPKDNPYARRRG